FTQIVFRYAGGFSRALLVASKPEKETTVPPGAAEALHHWRDSVRQRREVPLGFTEGLLHGEAMENVDAEILSAIYNPARTGFFDAYVRGVKHKDLRFLYRPR